MVLIGYGSLLASCSFIILQASNMKVFSVEILLCRKYSGVKKWTLGLTGGRDQIAIIRAGGSISRVKGPLSTPGSSIIAEQLIEKIRSVRGRSVFSYVLVYKYVLFNSSSKLCFSHSSFEESKKYKAAIIRIDSPGGDALASDL